MFSLIHLLQNRADAIGATRKADNVGTMQLPQLQQMPGTTTGTSVLESNKEKLIVLVSVLNNFSFLFSSLLQL